MIGSWTATEKTIKPKSLPISLQNYKATDDMNKNLQQKQAQISCNK